VCWNTPSSPWLGAERIALKALRIGTEGPEIYGLKQGGPENRDEARKAVAREADFVSGRLPTARMIGEDENDWPDGDGGGMGASFTIRTRGDLTYLAAKHAGSNWRKITARYPKATFILNVMGYDDDPRELWEFEEVCRYVQWRAEIVALDSLEAADFWVGSCGGRLDQELDGAAASGLGVLCACGVFGEEMRREAVSDIEPTTEQ
jgi:hypothetical protein